MELVTVGFECSICKSYETVLMTAYEYNAEGYEPPECCYMVMDEIEVF